MPKDRVQANFRISPETRERFKARARLEGRSTDELAEIALLGYLASPASTSSNLEIQSESNPTLELLVIEVADLQTRVAALESAAIGQIDELDDELELEPLPPASPKKDIPPPEIPLEGLTLEQICRHYGLSFKNLSRNAKAKNFSKLYFLYQETGVQWTQHNRRYYPLSEAKARFPEYR